MWYMSWVTVEVTLVRGFSTGVIMIIRDKSTSGMLVALMH
jgi:hypothetical protein